MRHRRILTQDPEKKDIDRALGMVKGKKGDSDVPLQGNASKMAKLITKADKLVRRAKAVAGVWGTREYEGTYNGVTVSVCPWKPFADRLIELGFDYNEITKISEYVHDDPFEVLGIDEIFM